MARDSSGEYDRVWEQRLKRTGLSWEKWDNLWRASEMAGNVQISRVMFRKIPGGWRIVVTAVIGGSKVVKFHDVAEMGQAAGQLKSMVETGNWKEDKPFVPAPSG